MLDRTAMDCALNVAQKCLDVIRPCLRPEEVTDAYQEFARIAAEELEKLDRARALRDQRLHPVAEAAG